jgi:cell division protein FtsL
MSTLDRFIVRPAPRARLKAPSVGARSVLIAAGLALAAAALLQVVQTSNVTTAGYQIQRLDQERLQWQASVHQLEAEVASLASVDRIEQEARGRLGMVPAESRLYLKTNVPVPSHQLLPTRFSPPEAPEQRTGEPWWRDLLELLPFF